MDTNAASKASRKVSTRYGALTFCLVAFTCVAAWSTARLTSAIARGSPDAFTDNNISLLGLIFTAIAAVREWFSITRVEPETDSTFRLKRRAFALKAGTAIAAVLLSAAALGIYLGIRDGY